MPKVNDLKAYYKEIATKAGLNEDEMKQVLSVMDNDKFARAFGEGFKPLPDYSHDLDDVRNRTKAEKDAEYKGWFDKEQQKYNEYLTVTDQYKKYKELYGELDNPNQNVQPNNTALSKEDFEKLMDARLEQILSRRDQAYLGFRDADFDHMKRFNRPMDRVAFEKSWKEHPEWGGDLKRAYDSWIQPEVEKASIAEWEKKIAAAREEGIRDGYSRRALPADHEPKTFSPLYDQKQDVLKMTEREQEQHSRNSFFEGFREANKPS